MDNYLSDQVLTKGVRVQVWVPDYSNELTSLARAVADVHGQLGTVIHEQFRLLTVELDSGIMIFCWPRELRPGVMEERMT